MNEVLENINTILSKLDEVITEYGDKPVSDSQFEKECSNYPDKARINEPFAFGRLNLRAGREYLAELPDLFRNNNIFASAVVARAVLEASTLAVWFLTPSIDENERVKRGLIQLCDGKVQIRKLGGDTSNIDDFFANRLPSMLTTLGIEFRNRKGVVVEPQQKKPKISDLIEEIYGNRGQYGILSAIAHGQPAALATVGYDVKKALAANGLKEIEYNPNQAAAMFVLMTAVDSYRAAVQSYFEISNWDFAKVKPSFDSFRASLLTAYMNNPT